MTSSLPRDVSAQTVLVTAGASGIGWAIARRFLTVGARVALCDVDANALDRACEEQPLLLAGVVDVSDETQVDAFVTAVKSELGPVDTLVNNAGIAGGCAPIATLGMEDWRRSFNVNVHGCFSFLRAVTPDMEQRGGGAVINISTGSVFTLPVNRLDYIASKWAVEGLTRGAAKELGPAGIRVNAIRPGLVDGPRMQAILQAQADSKGVPLAHIEAGFLDFISMRAKVQPHEIADLAVFLASPAARHITGQLIGVDGNIEWEQ
ncbi:SDR family oxidoreductase [Sphingobium subterraneum]|uniref:NAD(P)-dependent dehydrogenase (Short-subunit alcohol dehydrogenase family) n=1 Tax=Sphingobium subterraneum TaxID=627688 RepID=A0A841J533_9SPHN|nr:SDR family oxidoreductase [Sphingobium subterraneum]MBB6123675.1 NAD(P)-dependent dehydrogenase (short-subunit alcohol dehydrogenase family) [Sphingobium subterraneum]